jgi:hypothetical protein
MTRRGLSPFAAWASGSTGRGGTARAFARAVLTATAVASFAWVAEFSRILGWAGLCAGRMAVDGFNARRQHVTSSKPPDWTALRSALSGTVVLPEDGGYDEARAAADLEFTVTRPQAVVCCESAADVTAAVGFARSHGVPAVPRSGGHSFAGYSTTTGMVVDLSRMNEVTVDGDVVHVQAGTQIVDLYDTTLRHRLAVPTGWCPTVAVGGLTLGGGLGIEARKHGLAADNLLAAEVVLADGRVVSCDERRHQDLFWALRGGGGGNFGIVTSYTFRAHPARTMTNYSMVWPWAEAVTVVHAWQDWAFGTPDEMTPMVTVELEDAGEGGQPRLNVQGAWLGEPGELGSLLDALIDAVGSKPETTTCDTVTYRDGMAHWFGCDGMSPAESHFVGHNAEAKLPRIAFARGRGSFLRRSASREGIAELLAAFDSHRRAGQMRNLEILTLGGAVNRVPSDATAFAHRDSQFFFGYSVGAMDAPSGPDREVAEKWVNSCWDTLQRYSSPHSYQNFADPALVDWRNSYYGANYPRLRKVRAVYDPDRFFRFPQAID